MKKPKMIKQRWIIAGVILLVILVALGVLYLMQQENIKAAANARKYTQEQLQQQLEETRQALEEDISSQLPVLQIRDLTEEEKEALREGTISREELIEALLGPTKPEHTAGPDTTPEPVPPEESKAPVSTADPVPAETRQPSPVPTAAPAPTAAPTPSPEDQYQEEMAGIIAELYVMREEFSAKLAALAEEAKAEYRLKPESERTKSKLISWASGYAEKAYVMERECDKQMDGLMERAMRIVTRYGKDPEIVTTLMYSYAQEKSIQKSLYIQELEKRGIM